MTSVSLSLLLKLVEALIAGFLRALPWASFFGGSGDGPGKTDKSGGGGPDKCPYQVLGLEEGNATLEEATKARRRLALKWHPDRNIDNTEEATRKMQEINDSYHQIEKKLSGIEDDDAGGDDESDSSDSESEDRRQPQSKSARKKAENSRRNRERRDEEAEFEREMKAEFRDFERAQRNADGWGAAGASPFARPTSTSFRDPFPSGNGTSTMGNEVKGKSKAARKRARRKANKENRRGQTCSRGASSTTTSDVPFHRLSPQKRCEIKFGSPQLARSPVVTAILAKTYHVLQIYCLCSDPCGPIPLPSEEEGKQTTVVTPLMIASYLGDYAAADALISCVGDRWVVAVLANSHDGEDSLTLALEAKGISEQLYEEARGNLADANTDEERAKQEEIIEQHRKSVDGALKLVERLRTMKKYAGEKNRKKRLRIAALVLLGSVVWYLGWAMPIVKFVWAALWFIVKWGAILLVFYCFPVGTILAYLAYWMYTREPASSPPTENDTDISSKAEIDFFCTDGESCTAEGDSCTDGITEECCGMTYESSICVCGADLVYSCQQTNACLNRICESEGPSGNTNRPIDTMKVGNEAAHTVDIDPAAAEGGLWEGAAVVMICVLVIGALLYRLAESVKYGHKKKRGARRGRAEAAAAEAARRAAEKVKKSNYN